VRTIPVIPRRTVIPSRTVLDPVHYRSATTILCIDFNAFKQEKEGHHVDRVGNCPG
jgi:hypothetical protein